MTDDKVRLRVDNSLIHGKGLFARGPISAGTVLGRIKGINTVHDGSYVLWLSEHKGVRMLCKYKYINHSDAPNVVLYDTLEVCALRDIYPGEEITHDYGCAEWMLDVTPLSADE
ncbi:MAG: SET domain-containing protein-lysine N-methyltransferase [Gammaproteobacteria bacterium]|nr:SET domain-containing protein-lysine N-methyltransferase [Gammaproteobacteria bacterium]